MSLKQYLDAMERNGINRDMVLSTLYRHAQYLEDHGLTAGLHGDQTSTDHWEAMQYGRSMRAILDKKGTEHA